MKPKRDSTGSAEQSAQGAPSETVWHHSQTAKSEQQAETNTQNGAAMAHQRRPEIP